MVCPNCQAELKKLKEEKMYCNQCWSWFSMFELARY